MIQNLTIPYTAIKKIVQKLQKIKKTIFPLKVQFSSSFK